MRIEAETIRQSSEAATGSQGGLACAALGRRSGGRSVPGSWVVGCVSLFGSLWGGDLGGQVRDGIRIGAEPLLEIGAAEGRDSYLFSAITGALLLDDGRVVVCDGELTELRVYGGDGKFLHSVGGRGEGPGEFSRIDAIWLVSDGRIGVWDAENVRISTFSPEGELVSAERVKVEMQEAMSRNPEAFLGAFGDDDVILASVRGGEASAGVVADQWTLGRFSLAGEPRGLVGQLRGFRRLVGSPLPFTPIPSVAVLGDTVWAVDGYGPEIGRLDADGSLHPAITLPTVDIDADEAWSSLEAELQRRDDGLFLQLMNRLPPPDAIPQIGGLLLDGGNQLWVKVYDPSVDALWIGDFPLPGAGGEWRVVGSDGEARGTVQMPDGVTALHISEDRLVGISRGVLDVERLVVHRIQRGGG